MDINFVIRGKAEELFAEIAHAAELVKVTGVPTMPYQPKPEENTQN